MLPKVKLVVSLVRLHEEVSISFIGRIHIIFVWSLREVNPLYIKYLNNLICVMGGVVV